MLPSPCSLVGSEDLGKAVSLCLTRQRHTARGEARFRNVQLSARKDRFLLRFPGVSRQEGQEQRSGRGRGYQPQGEATPPRPGVSPEWEREASPCRHPGGSRGCLSLTDHWGSSPAGGQGRELVLMAATQPAESEGGCLLPGGPGCWGGTGGFIRAGMGASIHSLMTPRTVVRHY